MISQIHLVMRLTQAVGHLVGVVEFRHGLFGMTFPLVQHLKDMIYDVNDDFLLSRLPPSFFHL